MAFNLTANINARLANGGTVARQIRSQLGSIAVPIDVKISGNAEKNAQKLATSISGLNKELKSLAVNGLTASKAIDILGRSLTSFKGGVNDLNKTAAATKKVREETKKTTDSVAEFGRVSGLALRRNTGFLLATGAVYGLGRAITSSFSEAIRFEKELVKVAQVSNRSVSSLKPLVDEITRLSTGLGVASADLVDISLILAQAGLSANEARQAIDALAKTTLAATFGDIRDTTEGAIALMSQFEIGAKDLAKALGATNAVSAAFAVESEDIISAIKRAGGVFAQTSRGLAQGPLDTFNQFISVFSAVRATTRESAESIATGLRTIFTRVQRPATIQFLRELGIELTDLNGRFVGPFEAVNRLSEGLQNLDRRGSSFARVAEELGGFRQIGKTLALLSSSTQRLQALQVAQQGQNSVNKDAEQAQQSLANAIAKTRENFVALIREIGQTKSFDAIVRTVLGLANAFIKLADAVKPIIPLLSALALVKGISIGASFFPNFKKSLSGRGFAKGGKVSGGKGGIDDIPAMLTSGEYIINKKSANMIGKENLDELNRVGFARGGAVGRIRMNSGGDVEEAKRRLRASGLEESEGNITVELQRLKRERVESEIQIKKTDHRLGAGPSFSNRPGAGLVTREMLFLEKSMKGSTGRSGGYIPTNNEETFKELNQLRKLDKNLGKGQGARKERARLQKSLRDKTLRNETTNQSLLGIGRGGITPRFEANIGGNNVSGNSGRVLTGELSEAKLQKRLAAENEKRIKANKNFNAQEARLQQQELAANKARIANNKKFNERQLRLQSEEQRQNALRQENFRERIPSPKRQILSSIQSSLNSFTGVQGLGSIESQQTIDPRIARLRQRQAQLESGRRGRVRVTDSQTIGNREILQILNDPTAVRRQLNDLTLNAPADLFGTSQNVVSTFRDKKPLLVPRIQQSIARNLPTLSRLSVTKPGQFVAKNLSGRSGQLAAGGLLAGGILLSDKVGGAAGAAISGGLGGAFAGGSIGSAIAPGIGTAIGATVGGIVGAFKGFIDAKLDEEIKRTSDDIIKSISDVELGFESFERGLSRNLNIEELVSQFNNSFNGLTEKAVESSRVGIGQTSQKQLREQFGFTENERNSGNLTNFDANAGVAARQEIEAGREEVLKQFKDRQSDLGSASEAAKRALEEQLSRGINFDEAVKNLSPDAVTALAFGNANNFNSQFGLAQALVQSPEEVQRVARAQVLGGSLRVEDEERRKQAEILQKANNELAQVNNQTDLFVERMSNLAAVIDRASLAGEGFRRSNEALLSRRSGGAGIRSQQRLNVFDNTRAFSDREIALEANRVNAFLGNNANSREARAGVIGAKQLQTKLPSILNSLSAGIRAGGESETLLPQLINSNLGGLPAVLKNKLQSDIKTKFFANEQASPDDIANALAAGDVSEFQGTAQEINGIFKKLVDVTNQKIGEYEQVLDQFIQLNQEANQAQDNRLQILNDSANQEKQLLGQSRLSIADRSRGFNVQLGQFANRAGSGTSVEQLIAREAQLNSAREGSFTGAPDEIARQMALLTQQQQDSLRALELIVSNTDRQNALVEDLNSLIDSRREARQVFEDFAFGSPTERREIERNIDLARRQSEGEDFSGTRLKQAREGQRALQAIVGATQGQDALKALDQRQIDILDRSGASRLFGVAGVNPGVGVGGLLNNRDALFQGQFQELQNLNRQRGAAAAGIEGINRRDANTFEQNGRDAFNSFQSQLQANLASGGLLDMLNNTLQNLPEVIQIGGSVTHNINFNGLEAFAALEPSVRKMIEQHVNLEINRRLNPLTGETGPA